MANSLAEKENTLIERYAVIEDRFERLNVLMEHRESTLELCATDKIDAFLVEGCASRVWLQVFHKDGKIKLRYASESAMVRGLVALMAGLYHDANIEEAASYTPRMLEKLGLTKILSPTRLNALEKVIHAIKTPQH